MIYTTTLANPGDDLTTLNSAKLHVVKFKDSSVEGVRDNKKYKIEHLLVVDDLDTPDEKVYFKSICEDLDFVSLILMDMQKFTDQVYLAIQDKKLPDSTEYIKELKTASVSKFGDTLLKQDGEMTLDTEYTAFGFIYSGFDKVGTFEKIKFENSNTMKLIDVFSIIDLDKTEDLGIEYSLLNKKYVIQNPQYINNNTLRVPSITISDENNIEEVIPREKFSSNEEFIENRKSLLNINVGNDNLSIDEFDDLF